MGRSYIKKTNKQFVRAPPGGREWTCFLTLLSNYIATKALQSIAKKLCSYKVTTKHYEAITLH